VAERATVPISGGGGTREHSIQSDLSWFHKSWKWRGRRAVAHVRRTAVPHDAGGAHGREALFEDRFRLKLLENFHA